MTCFFLWVDALAKKPTDELLGEHEEWLPIMPQRAAAVERAPGEDTEGGARIDAVELRRLDQKIKNLEEQTQIPLYNYIWAFVGVLIALGEMLKLYGKA